MTTNDNDPLLIPVTQEQINALPAPLVIGPAALKEAAYHEQTGLLFAYDRATQAGGMINMLADSPTWSIRIPVEWIYFAQTTMAILQHGTAENIGAEIVRH